VQALVVTGFAVWVCDLDVSGPVWWLVAVAVSVAVLGTALGLGVSALAATEFQAVQFMPAIVLPQLLLCGLFVPRDALPDVLSAVSDVLPLSYSVDALASVASQADPSGDVAVDLAVVWGFAVAALLMGAATLRRRTP
jgi:ABC-2 type transport system permease protein